MPLLSHLRVVKPVIWVGYTTLYREGGARFRQAARTLAGELEAGAHGAEVRLRAVESKRQLASEMAAIGPQGLRELHWVAHGGMYGPLLGSRAWPEQLSREEWRLAQLPFAPGARAYFHTCRSARWFAPYFARTFAVEAYGYEGYTTFSREKHSFAWVPPTYSASAPLYVLGCPRSKSDGVLGALRKYAGLLAPEVWKHFEPKQLESTGYAGVADIYDDVFRDIRVRGDEWRWLEARFRSSLPLVAVDIGCGNGALLCELAPRLSQGLGVDVAPEMVARAERNAERRGLGGRLRFEAVAHSRLPLADRSVDRVVSLLSFRYLDWDPIVAEVRRVLKPGGHFLVVDMAASPLCAWQAPALLRSKARSLAAARHAPGYRAALARLSRDPRWERMLEHNPMRAEHELRGYLASRFPQGRMQVLNVGVKSKVLAFDSGPFDPERAPARGAWQLW
jgi:SAM-dependent methyltransferase